MTDADRLELNGYRARNYKPDALSAAEKERFKFLEQQACVGLPTRPLKRTYVLVEGKGLVDSRLIPQDERGRSAFLDPLFRGRLYRNITSQPIWVDSRRQLKLLLRKYNRVEAG